MSHFTSRFWSRMGTSPWLLCAIGLGLLISLQRTLAEDTPTAKAATDAATADDLPPALDRPVDFTREVLPLLTRHCWKCHGEKRQEAGLRLDVRQNALHGGDQGAAILAKKSAASLLVKYIAGVDPEKVMPPDGAPLSDEEIGLIRAWIDQGAEWPDAVAGKAGSSSHWAFQPLRRTGIPTVKQTDWIRTPVDAFVLAKLEHEGVAPSPEADRYTLIRRVALDLLGLPPTPQEVEEFVNDTDPQAYEKLIERMLASPRFGERWGRHWLDQARYADSDGYEKDNVRPFAYRYRDWVIDAINRDLPFDQFTVEQLAGDLLPEAGLPQRMATGFHRNTLTNTEGGADQEEFRVAATVDRVNTLGTVWLGLTLGCAQCHTHKYDPVTQREYYQLFAFFNSIDERNIPAPTPDEEQAYQQKLAEYQAAHAPLLKAWETFEREQLPQRQAAWEQSLQRDKLPSWQTWQASGAKTDSGATLAVQPDGSWLAGGPVPENDVYTLQSPAADWAGVTGFRLEALPDSSLGGNGPGRTGHGNFVVEELELELVSSAADGQTKVQKLTLQEAEADFEQDRTKTTKKTDKRGFPATAVFDGQPRTGWAVAGALGQRHVLTATLSAPIQVPAAGESQIRVRLVQNYGGQHTLGRFRLSVTRAAPPLKLEGWSTELIAALDKPSAERTPEQQKQITAEFITHDPEAKKLREAVTTHEKQQPPAPPTLAQVVLERTPGRVTRIMQRGDFLRPGDPVTVGTLAVLPTLGITEKSSRLDLARWLVSAENPLTPRVTVNLWWQHLFGRGIVATVDDFGVRGELPSHPELLDWLAGELLARKWSRKDLLRVILHSATYRQSAQIRSDLLERDPKNIWLARQNRLRVEAEVIRDLHLAASGLLDSRIGGPSVRPPLPPGVAELGYAGSIRWQESTGPDKYRRGMYIFYQRTVPYPMLSSFDAPDSNTACVRRERSNTPLQALTLLNDPVFIEAAQALGRRVLQAAPMDDLDARLRYLVVASLSRQPSDTELNRLRALYGELLALLKEQPEQAAKIVGQVPEGTDPVVLAALMNVARVVVNLDEFCVRP